ncbi:hypothetical protein T439DRAFT_378880 [Meredithblackwellia eburnea MCA 4105]
MSSSARVVSTYVPPLAKTTATAIASGATSFARVGTLSGASAATTGTATKTASIVDATGGVDSSSLLQYFYIPYSDAHSLSPPSWRYAYIMWMVLYGLLILWSIASHLSPPGSGRFGAILRKYSIRRIVFSGKRKLGEQPKVNKKGVRKRMVASPTIAQMFAIVALIALAFCLSLIGPDYLKPTTCTFGGTCPYQYAYGNAGGPPKSSYGGKRSLPDVFHFLDKRGVNNPNGWAPFNDPLLAAPNYDIDANWWTAGDRLGLIAFAMFPLSVTLAVKQWPFNIWATPFLSNYHFDKTAIMHRWSGRIIWLFSTAHTAAWTKELVLDKDPFGRPVFIPALQYWRFLAGLIAYGVLCILVLFSFKPFRTRYYEFFYWSHVILVVIFLAACIIHGHALMWWSIAALVLWGGDRFVRFVAMVYINAIGFVSSQERKRANRQSFTILGAEKVDRYATDAKNTWAGERQPHAGSYPPTQYDHPDRDYPLSPGMEKGQHQGYYAFGPGQDSEYLAEHQYPPPRNSSLSPSPSSNSTFKQPYGYASSQPPSRSPSSNGLNSSSILPASLTSRVSAPAGYAVAQLLPGRTIRLTLVTPRAVRWKPGQHVLLNVPAVRLLETHPYTILSVDERAPGLVPLGGQSASTGSELVLLIRAQKGFSKALWNHVEKKRREKEAAGAQGAELAKGVNLRAMVSWPMGSAGRVSWDAFESILIVCGGTGITFGISVLEYLCRKMARQNAIRRGGGAPGKKNTLKTTRVRFIWILREHAHLSWVAPALRRCLEMSSASQLQVDFFVSRIDTSKSSRPAKSQKEQQTYPYGSPHDDLAPPVAPFARGREHSRQSFDSDMSDSDSELPALPPKPTYSSVGIPHDAIDSVTDMILFDGEDDVATPSMSSKIQKEGKLRRARSRRAQGLSMKRKPKRELHQPDDASSIDFGPDEYGNSRGIGIGAGGRPQIPGSASDFHLPTRSPSSPYLDRSASSQYLDRSGSGPYGGYGDNGSFVELGGSGHGEDRSDSYSLGGSIRHLMASSRGDGSPSGTPLEDEGFMDLSPEDWADLEVIAELARPGHPPLDKILDDEISRSAGKTLVACCGPTELNTVIRHLVSDRIRVGAALRGDPKAQVSLVVEDFSF